MNLYLNKINEDKTTWANWTKLSKQIGLNNTIFLNNICNENSRRQEMFFIQKPGFTVCSKKPSSATTIISQEYVRQQTQSTFHYIIRHSVSLEVPQCREEHFISGRSKVIWQFVINPNHPLYNISPSFWMGFCVEYIIARSRFNPRFLFHLSDFFILIRMKHWMFYVYQNLKKTVLCPTKNTDLGWFSLHTYLNKSFWTLAQRVALGVSCITFEWLQDSN